VRLGASRDRANRKRRLMSWSLPTLLLFGWVAASGRRAVVLGLQPFSFSIDTLRADRLGAMRPRPTSPGSTRWPASRSCSTNALAGRTTLRTRTPRSHRHRALRARGFERSTRSHTAGAGLVTLAKRRRPGLRDRGFHGGGNGRRSSASGRGFDTYRDDHGPRRGRGLAARRAAVGSSLSSIRSTPTTYTPPGLVTRARGRAARRRRERPRPTQGGSGRSSLPRSGTCSGRHRREQAGGRSLMRWRSTTPRSSRSTAW